MAKAEKMTVPIGQLNEYLRRYQAVLHRDVSNEKAHVYFSKPVGKWIAVLRKGDNAILTFTAECPCADVGVGRTPF